MLHTETLELDKVPVTLQEALESKNKEKWIEAISKELGEMQERGVFLETEQHGYAMKSKLLFKIKLNEKLETICKARLVACGYSQRKGIDYMDTFSPTTTTISFHCLLVICEINNFHMLSLDIANAFLEGDTDFKNYMYLPKDLTLFLTGDKSAKLRVKLNKSLYGIKQAAKLSTIKLTIIC